MSSKDMDYNESMVYKELIENSKKLADTIMANIRRLGLDINFSMDSLTLADGNCFFRGIMQKCTRCPKKKWELLLLLQVVTPSFFGTPCTKKFSILNMAINS